MKNILHSVTFSLILLICAAGVSAQTADEVIARYIQAIGGKDLLNKITSVYSENKISVMGNETLQKSTLLNGKGIKQEMDMMGSSMVNCLTDKGGWMINPFTGVTTAQDMPEAQYKASRDQMYVGGVFALYAEKGYKAELAGNEAVGNINAVKVKLTGPDNNSALYFFDPATGFLIKSVTQSDMQGQQVDNVMTYSDYRQVQGYSLPYSINMNIGGQFELTVNVSKVELNNPVDPAIFAKPQ